MQLKRLHPDDLRLQQALPWNVFDHAGKLLLCQGYLLTREEQIESLLERGMYVDEREYQRTHGKPAQEAFNPFRLHDHVYGKLGHFLREVHRVDDFAGKIGALSQLLVSLSEKDPDAGLSKIALPDGARYTISHMMSVGIVVSLAAKRLNWSDDERLSVVNAAITMNVGMLELQGRLWGQRDPLTPQQRDEVEQHPDRSHVMLSEAGVGSADWLRAVRDHHENRDGTGYPRKINDSSDMAEVLRLADIYCAKLSVRGYRRPLPPNLAARDLFVREGDQGRCPLAATIIKEVGIYPPGTFVKLANGETAIVARRGDTANTPIVYSLASGTGIPFTDPVRRETHQEKYKIMTVVPQEKIMTRIDPAKIWGYD